MIEEQGWRFNTNLEINRSYSENLHCCDSAPCINFRKLIRIQYPELVNFLDRFGIDCFKPDELCWWKSEAFAETVDYTAYYSVYGTADSDEGYEIDFGGLNISIHNSEKLKIDSKMEKPSFVFTVWNIFLPWAEKESFDSVFVSNKKVGLWKRIFGHTK